MNSVEIFVDNDDPGPLTPQRKNLPKDIHPSEGLVLQMCWLLYIHKRGNYGSCCAGALYLEVKMWVKEHDPDKGRKTGGYLRLGTERPRNTSICWTAVPGEG